MDRVVGEVEKEGLIIVAIDEVDRFAGEGIGQAFGFHYRLTTPHDGVVGIVLIRPANTIIFC